ncbi:hypothetical protein KCU65_g6910, partial [Aureobasidium melanogenum]
MGEQEHLMSTIEVDSEDTTTTLPSTEPRYLDEIAFPSKTSALQTTKRVLHFLLPSFLHLASSDTSTDTETPKSVHPTAWLDGMRGVAALLVYIYHLSYSTHDVMTAWTPTGKRDFLRLPFIRFFYNGHFMVSIFFVLSGYALSYKPVKQIRNGELQALREGLASSVFRRGMRLYLPCFVSTLIIVLVLRLGMYDWTRGIAVDDKRLTAHREVHPERLETFGKQIWIWATAFFAFVNPFTATPIYMDGHLWTIPLEYVASIFLYVTQLGLCGLRTRYLIVAHVTGSTQITTATPVINVAATSVARSGLLQVQNQNSPYSGQYINWNHKSFGILTMQSNIAKAESFAIGSNNHFVYGTSSFVMKAKGFGLTGSAAYTWDTMLMTSLMSQINSGKYPNPVVAVDSSTGLLSFSFTDPSDDRNVLQICPYGTATSYGVSMFGAGPYLVLGSTLHDGCEVAQLKFVSA